MIQQYSTASYPPIPILEILLSAPAVDGWSRSIHAIVDSGADFTIAPLSLLTGIGAPMTRSAFLRSAWQERRPVYLYEVDVRIGQAVLPAVEIAGDPSGGDLLLGRSLLNLLDIRLEGPSLQIHLL